MAVNGGSRASQLERCGVPSGLIFQLCPSLACKPSHLYNGHSTPNVNIPLMNALVEAGSCCTPVAPCSAPSCAPRVPGLFPLLVLSLICSINAFLVFSETSPSPSFPSCSVNHLGIWECQATPVREGGTMSSPAHYRKLGPFPVGDVGE